MKDSDVKGFLYAIRFTQKWCLRLSRALLQFGPSDYDDVSGWPTPPSSHRAGLKLIEYSSANVEMLALISIDLELGVTCNWNDDVLAVEDVIYDVFEARDKSLTITITYSNSDMFK